jgi:transposase
LEAGPLSQWHYSVLAEAGLPVICVETRHMRAMLKAQINKTDRNDARGIAQMMRVGLYRPVHVKTLRSSGYQIPLGAAAQVAIYTEHWHHVSMIRKI